MLTGLCEKYMADKCPRYGHSYSPVYDRLLSEFRTKFQKVLEIGIGNGPLMADLTGPDYKPGASLRVWRDYFPKATIFGCDILPEVMFSEDRIETFVLDQSSRESLHQLDGSRFDLIIDDGSHRPVDMKLSFEVLWPSVNPGGFYIIEDIRREDLGEFTRLAPPAYVHEGTNDWDSFVAFQKPKRLVYTVACTDPAFARLIEFFPVRDALVICDPVTKDLIPDTFQRHVLPFTPQSPQEASAQKLRIFEIAPGYDEYMFLDLDIVQVGPVDWSRSWIQDPTRLHVVYETLWDARHHADMRAPDVNPRPFNAGQFTFTEALRPLFERALRECLTRPEDSYYEQGFMNDLVRDCAEFPFGVSFDDNGPGPLIHFVGPNKLDRVLAALKTKMSECLYPLPSKKPCGKPTVPGAPESKYGPLCARHAREAKAAAAPPPMAARKVMIGTLSYDGRVDVRFVDALLNTIRNAPPGVTIVPIYMSYDSLIQRARNDTVALALNNGFDDLIFIDSDIEWEPAWIEKLLSYPVDVVGGTYRKKTDDDELYVIKQVVNPAPVDTRTGLMKVDGLGCGFIRLSRRAMQYLWDASEPYEDRGAKRMIFEVLVEDGEILSEDIYMCQKLNRGGIPVHLDPRMCCNHTGIKRFQGNFFDYYQRVLKSGEVQEAG